MKTKQNVHGLISEISELFIRNLPQYGMHRTLHSEAFQTP